MSFIPVGVSQHQAGPGPRVPVSAQPACRQRATTPRSRSARTFRAAASRSYGAPYCSAHSISPVMSRPVSRTVPASARRPASAGTGGCEGGMAPRSIRPPGRGGRKAPFFGNAGLPAGRTGRPAAVAAGQVACNQSSSSSSAAKEPAARPVVPLLACHFPSATVRPAGRGGASPGAGAGR